MQPDTIGVAAEASLTFGDYSCAVTRLLRGKMTKKESIMKAMAIDQASVLLIDPSVHRSKGLTQAVSRSKRLNLLNFCKSFEAAYNLTEAQKPTIVAIAEELVSDPGFHMYKALLDALGLKVVVLCSPRSQKRTLDRIGKVVSVGHNDNLDRVVDEFLEDHTPQYVQPIRGRSKMSSAGPIVVIGASTGGVEALSTILSGYPRVCPPTLIVQHIGHDFVASFANRLNRLCPADVKQASDGVPLNWGEVFIAPGQPGHLKIDCRHRSCRIAFDPPVSGHRPSVDALFHSAVRLGRSVIAVLLTGMGRDGAEGMLRIRQAGGRTFAQNEDSCVVYGMPRVAQELGGVEKLMDIQQIGPALLEAADQMEKGHAL